MSPEQRLEGLVLRSSPLGETDRLLTLLSASEGLTRLAAPGARKPKSSLAAAVPLAVLSLQVGGRSGLRRVRQLRVLRNFSALAERLETLAAAQGLAELTLQLVPSDAPVEGVLDDLLLQLNRLEAVVKERQLNLEALAIAVQGSVQLLALGGYALPLASCARSGDGELMGPEPVWLRLLQLVEIWSREHLGRSARSWRLLRQCYSAGPWAGASSEPAGT